MRTITILVACTVVAACYLLMPPDQDEYAGSWQLQYITKITTGDTVFYHPAVLELDNGGNFNTDFDSFIQRRDSTAGAPLSGTYEIKRGRYYCRGHYTSTRELWFSFLDTSRYFFIYSHKDTVYSSETFEEIEKLILRDPEISDCEWLYHDHHFIRIE